MPRAPLFVEEPPLRARLLGDLDRLEAITESALDLVRGLAEEPTVRIELHELLDEMATDFRDAGHDVSFAAAGTGIDAACRPVMLRRALVNLVDNALRHGGGSAVLLLGRDASGGIEIRVRDRGAGIEPECLQEAFEPFRRLDGARARARATGGTGLGLTLARSVARRHGGDVTLGASDDGPGLVATLRFPAG